MVFGGPQFILSKVEGRSVSDAGERWGGGWACYNGTLFHRGLTTFEVVRCQEQEERDGRRRGGLYRGQFLGWKRGEKDATDG